MPLFTVGVYLRVEQQQMQRLQLMPMGFFELSKQEEAFQQEKELVWKVGIPVRPLHMFAHTCSSMLGTVLYLQLQLLKLLLEVCFLLSLPEV